MMLLVKYLLRRPILPSRTLGNPPPPQSPAEPLSFPIVPSDHRIRISRALNSNGSHRTCRIYYSQVFIYLFFIIHVTKQLGLNDWLTGYLSFYKYNRFWPAAYPLKKSSNHDS